MADANGGINLVDIINSISNAATNVIGAFRTPASNTSGGTYYVPQTQSGISSQTVLLIGAALVAIVLLTRRR